jgi:hypothetical protein
MHKVVPADHACESIVAVGLWVECVMALEKSPICERDRFEICLTKHFKQDFFGFILIFIGNFRLTKITCIELNQINSVLSNLLRLSKSIDSINKWKNVRERNKIRKVWSKILVLRKSN